MYKFYMPPITLMGTGCLIGIVDEIKNKNYKKALLVSDKTLVNNKLIEELTNILNNNELEYSIFDDVNPNPTTKNVHDGVTTFNTHNCDYIISFGGGSVHDCAKGIALIVTNGKNIKEYEGINKSIKKQAPLICVNTTAGTASEMTIFTIITDEDRHIKMAIVDVNILPDIAINDPTLMVSMPKSLTAATGMDALTHAIEAYVSTNSTPITDACAVKSIQLIFKHLKIAVDNPHDSKAKESMAYAEYLAGMAFSNASLGYVHAMAHQLGGKYDLPHGLCNAVLLPHVCEFNKSDVISKYAELANAIGLNNDSEVKLADEFIDNIINLSKSVGTYMGLNNLKSFDENDIEELAENAMNDVCGATNPKPATKEQIMHIYKSAL